MRVAFALRFGAIVPAFDILRDIMKCRTKRDFIKIKR